MCVCVRRFTTDLVFWIGATWQLILNAAFMPGAAKDGAAEGGERGLKCAFTLHL